MVRLHDSDRPSRSLFALRWVVVGIAIAFLARALLVQVYVVPSASMTPALQPSDRVLVEKLTGAWRTPARGDIVVFDADTIDRLEERPVHDVPGDGMRYVRSSIGSFASVLRFRNDPARRLLRAPCPNAPSPAGGHRGAA